MRGTAHNDMAVMEWDMAGHISYSYLVITAGHVQVYPEPAFT